jgi:hypothetical protein
MQPVRSRLPEPLWEGGRRDELPPASRPSRNRPEGWERPEPVVSDNTPVRGLLHELGAVEFHQVLPPSVECVNLIPFPRPKSRHVR